MDVLVYGLQIGRALTKEERERLEAHLPPARRQRLLHTREDKWSQILCAYGLLAYAVKARGWERVPDIALTAEGKPWFPQVPEICFNLSHTEGAAACAVHDRPVGVDVEGHRPVSQRLLCRYNVVQEREFWEMWVRREAIAKCRGKGIEVLPHWDRRLEENICCHSFSLFPGIYAALAAEGEEVPFRCRKVTLDEILER